MIHPIHRMKKLHPRMTEEELSREKTLLDMCEPHAI